MVLDGTALGEEVRYFLSSLPATWRPLDLLALTRRHWHIENRLQWIRDVTFGKDACQVRSGQAPQVLAALRNAVSGCCAGTACPTSPPRCVPTPGLARRPSLACSASNFE